MCIFWQRGFCQKGSKCTFAHDAAELQPFNPARRQTLQVTNALLCMMRNSGLLHCFPAEMAEGHNRHPLKEPLDVLYGKLHRFILPQVLLSGAVSPEQVLLARLSCLTTRLLCRKRQRSRLLIRRMSSSSLTSSGTTLPIDTRPPCVATSNRDAVPGAVLAPLPMGLWSSRPAADLTR